MCLNKSKYITFLNIFGEIIKKNDLVLKIIHRKITLCDLEFHCLLIGKVYVFFSLQRWPGLHCNKCNEIKLMALPESLINCWSSLLSSHVLGRPILDTLRFTCKCYAIFWQSDFVLWILKMVHLLHILLFFIQSLYSTHCYNNSHVLAPKFFTLKCY